MSDEVVTRPVAAPKSAPIVHVLASSVEVVERTEVPSSIGGYGRRQPVHAMGGGPCEAKIGVDGCYGR